MFNFAYKRNRARLDRTVSELIDKYERTSKCIFSCKKDLLDVISPLLDSSKEEIRSWKDSETDYIGIAHGLLRKHADQLLTSGRYHLGSSLNPMTCARNLLHIYRCCLDYCVQTGDFTSEERDKEYSGLLQDIRSF